MRESILLWKTEMSEEAFRKYSQMTDISGFICVKDETTENILFGLPVHNVREISEISFDRIVITDDKQFEDIKNILVNAGVLDELISFAGNYFRLKSTRRVAEKMTQDCLEQGMYYLMDLGLSLSKANLFTLPSGVLINACALDEGESPITPVFSNLYANIWDSLESVPVQFRRDAVYFGALYEWCGLDEALSLIIAVMEVFHCVYLELPYPDTETNRKWHMIAKLDAFSAAQIPVGYHTLLRLERKKEPVRTGIYVALHKEARVPETAPYIPLWLGKDEGNTRGYATDKTTPSISFLNHRINECTGIYWMWKHTTADIIGLVHYRRYFVSDGTNNESALLTKEEIERYLVHYDCILPTLNDFSLPVSVQICTGLDREIYQTAYECYESLIAERQPAYLDAFHRVFEGHAFYPLNMFIMKRQLFDAYCEWLFSFLTDAATGLDFDDRSGNDRRIAGYFAERMLTVWVMNRDILIKELQVAKLEYGNTG